jgi:hypothetical protein
VSGPRGGGAQWLLAAFLLCFALSCGPADEPFVGKIHRSRFFEYHTRSDEVLCPTLLERLDEHAQLVGGKVGVRSTDEKIRYYKYRDVADLAANPPDCDTSNGACAVGDAVYSAKPFHAHEQAHTYTFRSWGSYSTGLLNEGEAVGLSCDPFLVLAADLGPRDALRGSSLDWRDLLYLSGNSRPGYTAAGFFVMHLVERYGWRNVAELHQRVPPGISASDFEREFARVFATSMDQAWASALDMPQAASCQKDWQCNTIPLLAGETATLDCDGEMHRSIPVKDGEAIALRFDARSGFQLVDCAAAVAPTYLLAANLERPRVTHWLSVPSGSYAIVPGETRFPSQVEFRTSLAQGFLAPSCDAAGVVTLDPDGETAIDFLPGAVGQAEPGSVPSAWIRVAGGGRTYHVMPVDLSWDTRLATDAIMLCDDCGGAAECRSILFDQITSVAIGDRAVVRLESVRAAPPPTRSWGQLVFYTSMENGGP